jgi:hypothetical protein
MKKTIIVPVAQVVELGKATNLTLGGGSGGSETRNQPYGSFIKKEQSNTVELGKATTLTLGGNGARHETPSRPNIRWN